MQRENSLAWVGIELAVAPFNTGPH